MYFSFLLYAVSLCNVLPTIGQYSIDISTKFRGRVDDLSFFEYLSPFCFLSIEFYSTFSIFYKLLPYFIYYYCISIRM